MKSPSAVRYTVPLAIKTTITSLITPLITPLITALFATLLLPTDAAAHHGVASLGVAGLQGPGAPIETSNSAVLPEGSVLAYGKLDYASFETYTSERDGEGQSNAFWIYGLGWGVKSYLTAYLFLPFSTKTSEDNSYNTSGFADPSLMAVLGMRYDGRLRLVPPGESLDDLEDLHLSIYGGLSIPAGDANIRDATGAIDPGMSLGFGRPSYTLGLGATRMVSGRTTACAEASTILFTEHRYADGQHVRFGNELRLNGALCHRFLTRHASRIRLDANAEAGFLALGRDRVDGMGETASGGKILYVLPGARLYAGATSFGAGVKLPVWTQLNEADVQQGAEGKERFRLLFTFGTLF